jgi:hypothetical protein
LDPSALEEAGITRVLSVMSSNPHKEEETPISSKVVREFIKMKDLKTFQSHPWYQTTSAIIDSALHAGERILIHWCVTWIANIVVWEFRGQLLLLLPTLRFDMVCRRLRR